jgi:integrase/recombinase XerC
MEKALQQIHDFMNYLQVEKNASLHTVNSYRADMECFIAFARSQGAVGEALFSNVDNMLIRAYIAGLADSGYAASTILRRVSVLKTFFRFLSKEYGVDNYPFSLLHTKTAQKEAPAVLSVDEMTRLLNMPQSNCLGVRDRAILELLYASGLRVGELVKLMVRDVELDAKYVLIYGKKARLVPIGCQAVKAIAHYLHFSRPELCKQGSPESLFVNAQGTPLSDRSVRRIINKYAENLGKKITPHTIRYTMTAHLLKEGASAQVVREIVGQLDYSRNGFTHSDPGGRLNSIYKGTHPRA